MNKSVGVDVVEFGNDGIIQEEAFTMFGISAKDSENPIGEFGTGLKYAISVLLRNGRKIWIESGDKKYVFTARDFDFRNETFSRIYCNDTPTSFTTKLGKNWKLWQAYRELLSNCWDEGGGINYKGDTIIHAEIGDIIISDVFLINPPEPIAETNGCIIYDRQSEYLYRKNIRCYDCRSRYTYDLKSASLTEDRTIANMAAVYHYIAKCIATSNNKELIRGVINSNWFESKIDFNWPLINPSQTFINEVVAAHKNGTLENKTMLVLSYRASDTRIEHEDAALTQEQDKKLKSAKKLLEINGFTINCPVRIVNTLSDNICGQADIERKVIYINVRELDKNLSEVVSVLLEELMHIKYECEDFTRRMQNLLFDEIYKLMKKPLELME